MTVLDGLRHKGPEQRIVLEFRHDVFKYLFHGMGRRAEQKLWSLYEEKDFSRCGLPQDWNSLFDCHADGVKHDGQICSISSHLGFSGVVFQAARFS